MKLIIEKSVIVVTPTIGSPKLRDAIDSVLNQTYKNINHLIVIDGSENAVNAYNQIPLQMKDRIGVLTLPYNTGKTGGNFYGHRIYAGIPHLLNADYIFFLDEDNWIDSTHVESLVDTVQGYDWAFSLRKIVGQADCVIFISSHNNSSCKICCCLIQIFYMDFF